MIVHDMPQRSPEWFAIRLGRLCGSRAADMAAQLKSGDEAASRRNLRMQLVLERITGRSLERVFQSGPMRDGIEREGDALAAYEAISGRFVERVGYCTHPDLMAGCSPDGFVGGEREGLIEAKSPLPATHLEYLRSGKVPSEYYRQVVHGLWITGAHWCDWLSYHPDFPEPLQVKLVRVRRDTATIAAWELLVRGFLNEVDRETAEVKRLAGAA